MKRNIDELAILGGHAAFATPQVVGRPNIGDRARFQTLVDRALDSRWLSNDGQNLIEFEERVARRLDVRHCVAVANATLGLEILARATGMTGEVIMPAFTFIATAHALQWQQLRPVFCDIDANTHNIDPISVERLIGPRTSAIIAVHLWGRPAPMEALQAIADARGLQLVTDASHAMGCSHAGRPVGGFGRAEVFSFHATKLLNTFEGGAIATNDDALATRLRRMRNFGFVDYDRVEDIGTNAKMNEVSAAMGLANLESLDSYIATNRDNYHAYRAALEAVPGLTLCQYDERERCNYQYIIVEMANDIGMTRDQLVRVLVSEGIVARRYFWPGCHRSEPYRSAYPEQFNGCPVTDDVAARVIALPNGSRVDREVVAQVCSVVEFVMRNARRIADRIGPVDPHAVYGSP